MASTAPEIVAHKTASLADVTEQDRQLALEEVDVAVRNFCNLHADDTLPEALTFTIANMAVDLLKAYQKDSDLDSDSEDRPLKSISMGEVSMSFEKASADEVAHKIDLDAVIKNYEDVLFRHRKMEW